MKKHRSRRRKKIGRAQGVYRAARFSPPLCFFGGFSFLLCLFSRGGCLTRREAARLLYQAPATVPFRDFAYAIHLKMKEFCAIIQITFYFWEHIWQMQFLDLENFFADRAV